MRRAAMLLAAATIVVAGCTGGDDAVADFGPGQPSDDAPELPSDGGLSLADVPAPDGDVPPPDAVMAEADWPQVAAWIRRENDAGRPVVVNFFASWCEPCVRELPMLIETAAATDDVTFLGINGDTQLALGQDMVDEYGIDFPTLADPPMQVVPEVGGRGLPHTVGFDVDGRMVARVFGEMSQTSLDDLLDQVR